MQTSSRSRRHRWYSFVPSSRGVLLLAAVLTTCFLGTHSAACQAAVPPQGQAGVPNPVPVPVPAPAPPKPVVPPAPVAAPLPPVPATVNERVSRLLPLTPPYCGTNAAAHVECRLGETLSIGVSNLETWMKDPANHLSDVVLILNGHAMKGLSAHATPRGLQFNLDILKQSDAEYEANRASWIAMLTELRHNDASEVHIAIEAGDVPVAQDDLPIVFRPYPRYGPVIVLFLVALLIAFLLLAYRSDILRDGPSIGEQRQTFSLARCQMAWWFFITMASFCSIWLVLRNYDSLTQGVLILSGISAATALAATSIDSGKRNERRVLMLESAALDARVALLPALIAAAANGTAQVLQDELAAGTARMAAITIQLAALPPIAWKTGGFLKDILSDENGISLHRFQMLGWTVILGFVFIAAVQTNLAMPDFSATLLGLMGISSGTYIGFKIPEGK